MTQGDWEFAFGKSLMIYLNGRNIAERDRRGQPIEDDSFLLMFNAHYDDIEFTLPSEQFGASWKLIVDTTENTGYPVEAMVLKASDTFTVTSRSIAIFRQVEPPVVGSVKKVEEVASSGSQTGAVSEPLALKIIPPKAEENATAPEVKTPQPSPADDYLTQSDYDGQR